MKAAVFGYPPPGLAAFPAAARQLSPLVPGSDALEDLKDASLDRVVMAAPPGTVERRFALAHALRVLKAGGDLVAMAPKDKGGSRLKKELEAFGCAVVETAKRHQRICACKRPEAPTGLDAAIADGAPQLAPRLGLWSQPGIFSWDRLDPGTSVLLEKLPVLSGRGADLGAGVGVLAKAALASPAVTEITLVDIDRRAVAAAKRNIDDPRASFLLADVRDPEFGLADLDFVVMNPPFHDGGAEDKALGLAFVQKASAMLRKGGVLRMVANVTLPYEAALKGAFKTVTPMGHGHGYKLFEAKK